MITFEYYFKNMFWFKTSAGVYFCIPRQEIKSFNKKEEEKKFMKWIRLQEKKQWKPETSGKILKGRPCSFEKYENGEMIFKTLKGEEVKTKPNRMIRKIDDLIE